ncbi:MAG: protein O-mannosyl-transferase family [Bacteroidales bacterium]
MATYKRLNTLIGWAVFTIASSVYIFTSEPTASFWDCGEYIATGFKLQVGHPPGAPLFQMLARFFSLFAMGNTLLVAKMVNTMSALASGFTIMFLFWSITHLARKLLPKGTEISGGSLYTVIGSGLVGSLAYTFSDSFWFSAVEGEVYALSSFFTAIVVWAILRWEEDADTPGSYRWIILIAYLMGLSIGVHLLNLLAIPAITLVFYFRKTEEPKLQGVLAALLMSFLILAGIMYGIIPWIVKLAGLSELLFVNGLGLPFNSGTIIYFLALIASIVWALMFFAKRKQVVMHTIILSFLFILVGYSSFLMLVIRANADTPINENRPDDAVNLLSYLNRDQYGTWPLFSGQYYNAPMIGFKDGNPVYTKDMVKGKYVVKDYNKRSIPVYDPSFTTIFPRMWSNSEKVHADQYKSWGKVKGVPVEVTGDEGRKDTLMKPVFSENLRFFFSYQVQFMYFRYFMWNFAGRQNDNQGLGDNLDGNWISGIPFLDNNRLGPQTELPESRDNKGHNVFFLLPFILGLAGLYFHINRNYQDSIIVALLFLMTGLAIVVYLNQYSPQPRERDYAFAASFYAFAIWIGLGVFAISDWLGKKLNHRLSAITVSLACLLLVPGLMAKEGWDDHDRSGRYTTTAIGKNYLASCAPNAILFTLGDNDTFPLWYAQEVEGYRTDVRVVNLSYLGTDWYISQMNRKVYNSEPIPFSLPETLYRTGSHDITYLMADDSNKEYIELKDIFDLLKTDETKLKFDAEGGTYDYFPTNDFKITIDKEAVLRSGTLPKSMADSIADTIKFSVGGRIIQKNQLMVLDLLANNNWQRPVYFAITTGKEAYLGLEDYLQLEGLAYRLVPLKKSKPDDQIGSVNSDILYDSYMNRFTWGGMDNPKVYLDETNRRLIMNFRSNFGILAKALINENKKDSAVAVCDRCLQVMPDASIHYNFSLLPLAEVYYKAGAVQKGDMLYNRLTELYYQNLVYYFRFPAEKAAQTDTDRQQALAVLQHIFREADKYGRKEISVKAKGYFDQYFELYQNAPYMQRN